jgi:hypothetical protein
MEEEAMLRSEFEEAARQCGMRIWFNGQYGEALWDVLTEAYQSDALDDLLIGPERHLTFARWVNDNDTMIGARVSVRHYEREIEDLQAKRDELERQLDAAHRRMALAAEKLKELDSSIF